MLCLWRETIVSADPDLKIIPDGVVDLLWSNNREPIVVGPMTQPVRPNFAPGTELYGLRFRPGVAHRVLGVDVHELVDREVELHDIWPATERARWRGVADAGSDVRLESMTSALESRLADVGAQQTFVEGAAAWLATHPFEPVSELGRLSDLSQRQVQRRFVEAVGYGPKLLQRILRIQLCLWLAQHADGNDTLAGLATAAGYADQSHMTRELHELAGELPSTLLGDTKTDTTVSDLFNTRLS